MDVEQDPTVAPTDSTDSIAADEHEDVDVEHEDVDVEPAPPAQVIEQPAMATALDLMLESVLESVLDSVAGLDRRMGDLARVIEHNKALVDKLHAENQRLRSGELTQAMAPLLRDLIRLFDQLVMLDDLDRPDQAGRRSSLPGESDASLVQRQLLEILARAGVELFEVPDGEAFDASRHQGMARRPTDDADADGRVAETIRPGFTGPDGRALRAAQVEVWRHEPDIAAPDTAPDTSPDDGATDEPAAETPGGTDG